MVTSAMNFSWFNPIISRMSKYCITMFVPCYLYSILIMYIYPNSTVNLLDVVTFNMTALIQSFSFFKLINSDKYIRRNQQLNLIRI